jgi:hypothetical protein
MTTLDFKIYKPLRPDALAKAGVTTEAEFATFFADMIAKETQCEITGTYADECVHLHTDESNMVAVSDALEARGLSHRS